MWIWVGIAQLACLALFLEAMHRAVPEEALHPRLGRDIQNWLGTGLQAEFQDTLLDPVPEEWAALVRDR